MPIILDQIRGLSDSKFSGIAGSVAELIGIDIHSTPGLTKVQQKLTKESGATVTEFVKVAIAASNGWSFWFSADSGKIWARSSSGTWTLAHTTTAAAGEHKCLGAAEYNGFVYWATQSRLHRIAIADADGSWANEVEDWATFGVTDIEFHPMAIQDARLFIGDANQMAEVDSDGLFFANSLDIKTPLRIKAIIDYELDILIGTYVADTVNKTEILRWDTEASTWNVGDPIEEVGINAFMRDDNFVYAQVGRAGKWFFYNGEQLEPFIRIPGDYSPTKYGEVYPYSVGNFKGVPIFGFSNGAGNPAKQGVYSFGSYSRNYQKVLDLSFVNSQDKTTTQEIGAILVLDFDIIVAWKDTANYGVDKIDYTAKYASASFETMMLFQKKRDILKTLRSVSAYYNSLPASTGITFSYSINGAAYVAMTSVTDAIIARVKADLTVDSIGSLQIKGAIIVNNNDAPTFEAFGVEID